MHGKARCRRQIPIPGAPVSTRGDFWIAGSPEPSGKYTDCIVKDRGNWSCKVTLDKTPSITHEMVKDRPQHDPTGHRRPFHAVPKWEWWLLRAGFPGLSEASY